MEGGLDNELTAYRLIAHAITPVEAERAIRLSSGPHNENSAKVATSYEMGSGAGTLAPPGYSTTVDWAEDVARSREEHTSRPSACLRATERGRHQAGPQGGSDDISRVPDDAFQLQRLLAILSLDGRTRDSQRLRRVSRRIPIATSRTSFPIERLGLSSGNPCVLGCT